MLVGESEALQLVAEKAIETRPHPSRLACVAVCGLFSVMHMQTHEFTTCHEIASRGPHQRSSTATLSPSRCPRLFARRRWHSYGITIVCMRAVTFNHVL